MQPETDIPVRRRRVFYIPGYDPIPPRRYRELYRREAADQAKISGYDIAIERGTMPGWKVRATQDGAEVEAEVSILVWSDIVRASMGASIPATYGQLIRTAWTYITSGALFGLMRLRKGPVIAALYPVVALILQAVLAIGMGALVGVPLARWLDGLGGTVTGTAVGTLIVTLILRWFRKHDGRIFAYYLMHDYAFTARWQGANPPGLETRMATFADRIAEAVAQDWDEVLIVGHSSGAHLAVSVLADLSRAGRLAGGTVSLLTLGQVVPMVSFLPKAQRLRADLAWLSAQKDIFWVDVTAPGDGCAFALCDPVAVSGVAPPYQTGPLILSAAFTQTLSPERWKALKRRYFRLHFQYLCAFDRPGDYDYFRITAGPLSLRARYRERAPSKSRITRSENRYTSVR